MIGQLPFLGGDSECVFDSCRIGPEAKDAIPSLVRAFADGNTWATTALGRIDTEGVEGAVSALIRVLTGQDEILRDEVAEIWTVSIPWAQRTLRLC